MFISRRGCHRKHGFCSLRRGLIWAQICAHKRRLSRVLPPLEVLLVRFETGIHLEQAAEVRNCNTILSVCHGFSRRNQSSTDRCCSDALTACSTGRAGTVRIFIASGHNSASTLLCAKPVPSQRAVFSSGWESRAEPRGAGTQCNFKMTAEEASCASEGDDSEF